jgi:AraC family transcriptional regulator
MSTRLRVQSQHQPHKLPPGDPQANFIDFSEFWDAGITIKQPGYALKYVLEGTEKYEINGQAFAIRQGQYFLLSPGATGYGDIKGTTTVRGICVRLAPRLVAEVYAASRLSTDAEPDRMLAGLPNMDTFWGHQPNARIPQMLHQVGTSVLRDMNDLPVFDHSFFYQLAESYLIDYQVLNKQHEAIGAAKSATVRELHRRLLIGKYFIEDCYQAPITVTEVAREAMMSEYQFYRLFKSVFGVSPYQYILHKRLHHGYQLLTDGRMSITEVATLTGFADVHSFSKAFKKHFGVVPSAVLFRAK